MFEVTPFGRAYRIAAPPAVVIAKVAITVTCAVLAGVTVSWIHGALTPIWLGTAVMLYWLLRSPRRHWPAIIAICGFANLAAGFAMGHSLLRCVLLALVNVSEALMFAIPLRLMKLDRDFSQPRTLLVFYALVVGPVTMISAALGAAVLHSLTGAPFFQLATEWYTATALGQAMLVPPLMTVRAGSIPALFARESARGTLLYLVLVAATIACNLVFRDYPLGFLFFPAVVLLTFQRGFAGGALGLLMVVAYMMAKVLFGDLHGALSASDARSYVLMVQLYTAVISFTVIVVGAGLEQRKKLERSLAEAHEEALVARDAAETASQAKTMFLANMSHELRTPLNAVIGFSELMHREIYGPLGSARYRDYAKRIHQAGQHLLGVIGEILDMSKIEAGKYEIVQEELRLHEVVEECTGLMRERANQKGVSLVSDLRGPERVVADRRALKQILLNLLSNAIKFTPAGGCATVSSRMVHGRLVLAVSDTGIGISDQDLKRLGNPFVQLRRTTPAVSAQHGTGLGLALVRALAEKHGGRLHIESRDGEGTCANVELPLDNTRCAAHA
ncbi:MAG TPA: ATP-binding protein [Rhizomicrobium sp.]|jgi:signal transduction histidine kinase|nr:ATP-binding protein [Rhizomicrobium sp.]